LFKPMCGKGERAAVNVVHGSNIRAARGNIARSSNLDNQPFL
jgi:hypothetical protein